MTMQWGRTVVIEPPARVVEAEEAKTAGVFTADEDDDYVETLLEIAQSEIDGPPGWLGRSIGVQTLAVTLPVSDEVRIECLPYQPAVEIISNEASDDGCSRVVTYSAGQAAADVPKRIKHAIILMAGTLGNAKPLEGGFVKKKIVEGVGTREFTVPDGASDAMKSVADRLLSTYRVILV